MISLFPPPLESRVGVDPIDLQLDRSGATSREIDAAVPARLRLPAAAFPGLVLLTGIATGPHGLALLTPAMLRAIDPLEPVALAALGVLAGLSTPLVGVYRRRTVVAQVQAGIAAIPVLIGLLLFAASRPDYNAVAEGPIAIFVVALAAATSSSLRTDEAPMDAVAPMLAGGAAIALIRAGSPVASLSLLAETAALSTTAAIVGFLLLLRVPATSEQRVFVFASVLLLGGIADYISTSALLSGLLGGFCWRAIGGATRDDVQRDMTYVQHSVVVMVLLVTGARADFPLQVWLLSAVYVATRTAGKLTAGWVAARLISGTSHQDRLRLVEPGIFGVALALDLLRAGGDAFAPMLSVVVLGTVASSMLVAVLPPEERG
jgi:hypothetical protein